MPFRGASQGRTVAASVRGGGPALSAEGFTLTELLVVTTVVAILLGLLLPSLALGKRRAKRTICLNNLKQFVLADTMYLIDNQELPPTGDFVPSSISVERLATMAQTLGVAVPPGPAPAWPKRDQQPRWINCPMAVDSGFAEGVTMGGGLYTGYLYVGGIERSSMLTMGFATLVGSNQAADRRNTRRGVLWADVLDEFASDDPRRFEFFHARNKVKYPDFRYHARELEGMHRAWSDGSVEWTGAKGLRIGEPDNPNVRLKHLLGNYYY